MWSSVIKSINIKIAFEKVFKSFELNLTLQNWTIEWCWKPFSLIAQLADMTKHFKNHYFPDIRKLETTFVFVFIRGRKIPFKLRWQSLKKFLSLSHCFNSSRHLIPAFLSPHSLFSDNSGVKLILINVNTKIKFKHHIREDIEKIYCDLLGRHCKIYTWHDDTI